MGKRLLRWSPIKSQSYIKSVTHGHCGALSAVSLSYALCYCSLASTKFYGTIAKLSSQSPYASPNLALSADNIPSSSIWPSKILWQFFLFAVKFLLKKNCMHLVWYTALFLLWFSWILFSASLCFLQRIRVFV